MKKTYLALLFLVSCTAINAFSQVDIAASKKLIQRIIPQHHQNFEVKYLPKKGEKDQFEIESKNGKIILYGNNGVAVASALNHYLKTYCNFEITWNGSNRNMPKILPTVKEKISKSSPHELRYYLNYCTFSYSMAWWDWKRWEEEIDWMALNGINMPLAITGQEAIWQKVYKSMGFTDKDLQDFFTGPAYFGWFYMNNMDAWGGPLPQSWIDSHKELQKKILARQRELGMIPVLPAFTGHVPKSFIKKFPKAQVDSVNWQGNFPNIYMLNPNDPMFSKIGQQFLKEQTKEYGTDHYYSSDIFNELNPPSSDPKYLHDISEKVYASMKEVDPKSVWVMQAWLFVSAHGRKFWTPERMQAFLKPVPNEKLIILDLYTENRPRWKNTEGYYGKKWVWNMLHNFGGNIGLFGKAQTIASEPARVLSDPMKSNYSGIGLTMEAIEQNPFIYQLMLEHVWNNEPVELEKWTHQYITRRYGTLDDNAIKAWDVLLNTVYKDNNKDQGAPESILTGRPTFAQTSYWTWTDLYYDNREFVKAWDYLIKSADQLKNSDGFQYDIVDVTRQAMANYATALQRQLAYTYHAGDAKTYEVESRKFLELLSDMDKLLATRKDFLLGVWIEDAKKWATNPEEKKLYEFNARDLVTMWGHKEITINDYSARQWSGLIENYYKQRWKIFFDQSLQKLKNNQAWDQLAFEKYIKDWEWNWVNKQESYPTITTGNAVDVSKEMYNKYFKVISTVNVVK